MEMEIKQKNEELLAQEEELRQNLEEMQTTQEELLRQVEENKKIQEDLKKETYLLNALLGNIPEHIYFKDLQSKFIRASNSLIKIFNMISDEELIGNRTLTFLIMNMQNLLLTVEQKIIKTGKHY